MYHTNPNRQVKSYTLLFAVTISRFNTSGCGYLIGSREEGVGHLVQVGSLAGVDVTEHPLEYVLVEIIDLNTVLREGGGGGVRL